MATTRFSLRMLQDRCQVLERHVVHRHYASPDELAQYRPGGSENLTRGMAGWVVFYAQLVRFCGREEHAEQQGSFADGAVLEALAAEPLAVTLSARDVAGQARTVYVYPKSLAALLTLHVRDFTLGWLAVRIDALRQALDPTALGLLDRAMEELGYQYTLLCWSVTHAEPGLPYARDEQRPTPPAELAWLAALDPWDCLRVAQAHGVVNAQRLQALEALITKNSDPTAGPTRPSWSAFIGSLAMRLNQPPGHLMRDASLVELLSAVQLHASAEREANEAAKRAATGSGGGA